MPASGKVLVVEGRDELWFLEELLKRRGVAPDDQPQIIEGGGYEKLAPDLPNQVLAPGRTHLGIVLDSDPKVGIARRWQSLINFLKPVVTLPEELPEGGFIGSTGDPPVAVGIWIMPDNSTAGMLEDMIIRLVPDEDRWLVDRAGATLITQEQKPPRFRPTHQAKALVHTWLAWRDPPGVPLRHAFNNELLLADHQVADPFFTWLTDTFQLPAPAGAP